MSQPNDPSNSDVPLFDVFVELPPDITVDAIDPLALQEAGLTPERVEVLLKALRNSPKAKIGASVTRERSNRAEAQFGKAGLVITVVPLLGLQAMVTGAFDGRFACPACNQRVVLPENRQCPSCGVFVDKVDEAFLLRRKIMQQERSKLDFQAAKETKDAEKKTSQSLEAALRAKIREELEAEYGIQKESRGLFRGKAGLVRATALLGLVATAFLSGQRVTDIELPWGDKAAKATSSAKVDKMLNTGLGKSTALPESSSAPSGTGDPDIDNDPMMQAIGGNRVGAKGLSMEQALSAATVLAKSVGNTTAERAMAGGAGATSVGASVGTSVGTSGASVSPPQASTAVPVLIKLTMQSEFALSLAELGQLGRSQGILKIIKANPSLATDPQSAASVKMTDLEVQAWALPSQTEGKARRAAADALRSQAEAIADPTDRALALCRVAAILSQQTQLSPEVSRAFLTLAASSLKTIPDVQRKYTLVGEWAVSMATVLLAEATSHAKAGRWAKAQTSAESLDGLIKQAPGEQTLIKLHAVQFRLLQLLGQSEKANQSLTTALTLSGNQQNFSERASSLRAIAQLGGTAARAQVQQAATALSAQIEPASGPEKAQALVQLALLHAEAGSQTLSDRLSQRAESATGLTAVERLEVKSDLIVRTDLGLAKALHKAGNYAQSEALLQRISDYLF